MKTKNLIVSAAVIAALCLTGCGSKKTEQTDMPETAAETAVAPVTESGNADRAGSVTNTITVSSQEEYDAAQATADTLFTALENGDAEAIESMFSEYGRTHAANLKENIGRLLEFYPGADGGYECVGVTTEEKEDGKRLHVLELIFTVRNGNDTYKIETCIQMKNESEPEKEGVHLIQALTPEELKNGTFWKGRDAEPGVYVTNADIGA